MLFPPMFCATPLVLAALSGTGPIHHPGVVSPPFSRTTSPPPASGKGLWGSPLANQVSSDNFTIGWATGDGKTEDAERLLVVLEQAWTELVETEDWPAPASSETYLLWVIFDRSIGHTGYTTLLYDAEFPDGVPVVYLNPTYASYGTFWEHLAVHEFNHMLQYAVRDWSGGASEAWYWEASAEWACELAVPELDIYALQTTYYAEDPDLRFDTINGGHEYGMLVLNAWLEEHLLGPGGLREVWLAAGERPDDDWIAILEDTTGWDAAQLWAGFSAALGNGTLREGALYEPPVDQGPLVEGGSGSLARLGTDYWTVETDTLVSVVGDAILGSPAGEGETVVARAGEVLTVTALEEDTTYSLTLAEVPAPTDTADTADTGSPEEGQGIGCGCQVSPALPRLEPVLVALGFLFSRRRCVAKPGARRV